MNIETVFLPRDLRQHHLDDRCVVVFDVLRATTSIATALFAGAAEVRVFDSIDAARAAARESPQLPHLLCGETNCLPPPGFDLGNSPGAFTRALCAGRTILLATTNGTRALVGARAARAMYAAALVNLSATAAAVIRTGHHVTILCAGTDGEFAMEDALGAGAVIEAIRQRRADIRLADDASQAATDLWETARQRGIYETFLSCRGGMNVLRAGLAEDLQFAARIDSCPIAARGDSSLVIRAEQTA